MNIDTVKAENGKVSCETPEGTVIHININQRSALDCLLDTFQFMRNLKKSGQKTKRMSGSAGNLGFGVAYVSLGLFSVMLAIITCIVQPSLSILYSGVNFWVGFPFLVSGILNLLAYKFPKKCWIVLAFISLLVNFSVSIAGIVLTVDDYNRLNWRSEYSDNVCTNLRNGRGGYYDRPTTPPRYYYESDYDLTTCKDGFRKYKYLLTGLVSMTLIIMIWGLCLAILRVGSSVKSYCCCSKLQKPEEKDDSLITPDPSDHIIIA